jgi:hypothetical protein
MVRQVDIMSVLWHYKYMTSNEALYDSPNQARPLGWFRLDVILTAATGITMIDWENEYWKNHPSPQPFQHEVGGMLSYLTLDGQFELHQLPRVSEEVEPSVREQLSHDPEIQAILDSAPDNDAPQDITLDWYRTVVREHKMDRLVELSPINTSDHLRDVDPELEFELMGGSVILFPYQEE